MTLPGSVHLYGNVRQHLWWKDLAGVGCCELRPEVRTVPCDNMIGIVPADKPVVGDIEIAGAGIVRIDAHADVLETAVLYGQSLRTHNKLCAGPDCDFRVSNSQSFEVGVIRGFDIEEIESSVAVEDCVAVPVSYTHLRAHET